MGTGDRKQEDKERRLQKAAQNLVMRTGEAVLLIDERSTEGFGEHMFVTEIRVQFRFDDEGDVLAMVKAQGGEGKIIAFQGAASMQDALVSMAARLRNGSLKWKEDKPYGE